MSLNFYEKQKKICGFLLDGADFDSNEDFVSSFCPFEEHYLINKDGEISYIQILEKVKDDEYNLNLSKENLDFLIEVKIIIEILESEGILYPKVISKNKQLPLTIESSPIKKEGLRCELVTNIQSTQLYNFVSSQIYVNKHKLKKFIKHKYRTESEFKESRDNKLFYVAICAILIPLIVTLMQLLFN